MMRRGGCRDHGDPQEHGDSIGRDAEGGGIRREGVGDRRLERAGAGPGDVLRPPRRGRGARASRRRPARARARLSPSRRPSLRAGSDGSTMPGRQLRLGAVEERADRRADERVLVAERPEDRALGDAECSASCRVRERAAVLDEQRDRLLGDHGPPVVGGHRLRALADERARSIHGRRLTSRSEV